MLKTKNEAYSLRAFARDLDINPSAVHEIMNGKRRVSKVMARKILNQLHCNPTVRNDILKYFPTGKQKKKHQDISVDMSHFLSGEQFEAISNWIHFAILSLMKTKNFQSDVSWMAERLASSPTKVELAVERLIKLGFIKRDDNGELYRVIPKINTSDDFFELSVQKAHLEDMEMAKDKIRSIDVKDRDFTSITLPVDRALLNKAKEIIRKAQDELDELMKEGECNEVYRYCSYLYPLTRIKKEKRIL